MANNTSNYSNILLDNTEYDEQINISLIRPLIETSVVIKSSSNHPETMLNKNSLENIENYIDEKYEEAAMSHLKQEILKDVEIAIKTSIDNNKKNDIVSCLQSHIDTLLSEIYFLREEIKEKNQLIKAAFINEDIMPRIPQNTLKNDWNITNDKTTGIPVLNNKEKNKKNSDSNTKSNTANTVISEASDSKSSPENIETKSSPENNETRNPWNDCKINEHTAV